jgi:hypothetical protein
MHSTSKIEPVAYGWVSLPMPKSSPPGLKKARLLADRPGLAVKAILVSRVRTQAPTEAEAKEFEQVSAGTLLQGLVGWWKLDEPRGPSPDASGHGHAGSWVNDPTFSPTKAPAQRSSGGSILFSGSGQYIDMANPGGFPSGKSPRSLSGWGKTGSTAPGFRWIAAFGTPEYARAMFIGQNGRDLFGGGFADDLRVDGFWDEQWHHIALTYDGSIAKLYADGTERCSAAKSWDLNPQHASIGRQVNYGSEYWNGQIDDVRIYTRVLTDSEIRQLSQGR